MIYAGSEHRINCVNSEKKVPQVYCAFFYVYCLHNIKKGNKSVFLKSDKHSSNKIYFILFFNNGVICLTLYKITKMLKTRRDLLFTVLAGFFITNAIVGEMVGGKLIQIGMFTLSIGIIPWPVVFLTTDLINEYYGKAAIRRLTFLTAALIIYAFILIFAAIQVPAASFSPVDDSAFYVVFGQSLWIIAGSITAFLTSQLIDALVFLYIKSKTGKKMLWLRATGSTVISQLIDTFIVAGIAFWLPGKLTLSEYINTAGTGYIAKLLIAIALTPVIYAGHFAIDRYLKSENQQE